MINLNNVNKDNLYEELLGILENQISERRLTSTNKDKLDNYSNFLKLKLEYISKIQTLDPVLQRKFYETFVTINSSNSNDSQKLSLILTYGTVINKIDNHLELLTDSESVLLALAMSDVPLNDYNIYGDILSSKSILHIVENITTEPDEQLDIFDEMLDMLDEIAYDDMDIEDYDNSVKGCINIASMYIPKEKDKNH